MGVPSVDCEVKAMDMDLLVGCIVGFGALSVIAAIVVWCRARIEWVARTGARSAREILKDLRRGG